MDQGEITQLLIAHREGDPAAFEQLVPLVYEDLRRIAHRQLMRLRPGRTLDTTSLVHEAYLHMVDQTRAIMSDRQEFFGIAARAMRQIVVDYARKKSAAKRGGGKQAISLSKIQVGVASQADLILAINQALDNLSQLNERLTRVFECRYFAGLTAEETAEVLDMSLRTVQRDWTKSKAYLRSELAAAP